MIWSKYTKYFCSKPHLYNLSFKYMIVSLQVYYNFQTTGSFFTNIKCTLLHTSSVKHSQVYISNELQKCIPNLECDQIAQRAQKN
jgi:hypothetical protein